MMGSRYRRLPHVEAGRGAAAPYPGGEGSELVAERVTHAMATPGEPVRGGGVREAVRRQILNHRQREQIRGSLAPLPHSGFTLGGNHALAIRRAPVERAVE